MIQGNIPIANYILNVTTNISAIVLTLYFNEIQNTMFALLSFYLTNVRLKKC